MNVWTLVVENNKPIERRRRLNQEGGIMNNDNDTKTLTVSVRLQDSAGNYLDTVKRKKVVEKDFPYEEFVAKVFGDTKEPVEQAKKLVREKKTCPANDKRDARIYKLWLTDKTVEEICNIVSKEFNEAIDKSVATAALERYCTRNKIDRPLKKRGRKPEWERLPFLGVVRRQLL
jgi:hypothetical protein